MKKLFTVCVLLFPAYCIAQCDIWTLEVINVITHEKKEYEYSYGQFELNLPGLNTTHTCSVVIDKPEQGFVLGQILCSRRHGNPLPDLYTSAQTCSPSSNAVVIMLVARTSKKPAWYDLTLKSK
jgi:hypothetical protein